ncbi:ABC-type branched-chain amino acid transport systems, ATPase component [Archaeoglobus sulfaticallidus PM70-1]|uniref:ABC-type branched-chain amino acid transport systems, ATPase component n=1 Tax=Archaeoglobus sulfaticallidus PM70-1 TaxID=387631 RepID=N0BJC8_9EURY|nr:ATP-binding cassette domain-containing protein [Archaeoglobus sulfaticallidus]AGK60265.1 ABC-type branched-chain amino acid transport systems, ATPase component [Archaeoglobus sulfaticallidus PM70-1]
MLKVKNVSKQFGDLVVLREINLEIDRGEVIGIFGPNGCGKSTLLRIISGFEKPSCGKIIMEGKNITGFSVERRAEIGISYAFQIPKPFESLTVFENVLAGFLLRYDEKEAARKASDLLRKFDIDHISNRKATYLSQGELKLLELCKSVSTEPELLLLDEPFSALDRENSKNVMKKVRLMRDDGIAMLITAHKKRILERISDRIFSIENGRLIVEG